jgi:hypothetical protein
MKIELRNLNHMTALSRETPAFTAHLYVDGKPRGTVRNSGDGGANYWSDRTVERDLNAYAQTLPLVDFDGSKFPETAETLIFGLVYDAQDAGLDPIGDSFRKEVFA